MGGFAQDLYRRQAGFPSDKRHQTTITKRQINALLIFAFLDNLENLVFIGPPGVGKPHLSIGIGQKAIEVGYRVLLRNALDLVEELELAEMKGELKKTLHKIAKVDALIIDELGYLPMSRQARYALFQLINRFYEHRTLVITANKEFTSWGEFFHDDNVAVPIVDRIIYHSHLYLLGGESYRLKQKTLS